MEENTDLQSAKIEKVNTMEIRTLKEKQKLLDFIDSLRKDKSFLKLCEKYRQKKSE